MSADLVLAGVSAGYGETVVLQRVSLGLDAGGTLAVLGRNGVGKTTLLATVMGHTTLHGGTLAFRSTELAALPAHRRSRLGIGYVPQEREIFRSLTVEENLAVAERPGRWSIARVYDFFPKLAERRRHHGNQLSGGEQQMLAIGRALLTNPTLLVMDEPSEGLAPTIVEQLLPMVRDIAASGTTVILVEQSVNLALTIAQTAYFMEKGEIRFHGPTAELLERPDVLRSVFLEGAQAG
ncbi:MAG TPA: ABC transporter ATP-binding protein, partial [Stellaceae bacterium]|nr:ABC transporter ATP-binding protein [Stellaceae bacterium]